MKNSIGVSVPVSRRHAGVDEKMERGRQMHQRVCLNDTTDAGLEAAELAARVLLPSLCGLRSYYAELQLRMGLSSGQNVVHGLVCSNIPTPLRGYC